MNIDPSFLITCLVICGSIIIMCYGLYIIHERIKAKSQGFGPNTLKVFGIILFIPTVLILATLNKFQPETLAALLGAIAGYALSNGNEEK